MNRLKEEVEYSSSIYDRLSVYVREFVCVFFPSTCKFFLYCERERIFVLYFQGTYLHVQMKSQNRKNFQKQKMFLVKLVSLNGRGINNFHKRRAIFKRCRKRKADVIFSQETHSKGESEKQWMNEWDGKIFHSHGSQNSCGVSVLLRKGFN